MSDHEESLNAQIPLAGVVLCCTSITPELRNELAGVAQQMGATHKYDLTSDVTHLLVGDINTQKYKYVAKERPDVKVVLPAWLEAVRQSWMEGGTTDVASLEKAHTVPTLHKLRITITGFDDLSFRQELSEKISRNGAEYSGDLTKQTTHLLAARPEGKKYLYARQWGVKIVSSKWLEHSIQRGMALEETAYDPTRPEEDQGKGAWNVMVTPSAILGKRSRDETRQGTTGDAHARKLRRTASAKLGSQNGSIWADITSHLSNDNRQSDVQWLDLSNSDPVPQKSHPSSPKRSSQGGNEGSGQQRHTIASNEPAVQIAHEVQDGIFQHRVIYVHGFDQKKGDILLTHLNANNATVCTTAAELDNQSIEDLEDGFLVIPDDIHHTCLPSMPERAERLFKVTNWWVEKCLHYKSLVDPANDTLCRPFVKTGINNFKGLTITSSGFSGVDLLHVSKAVKLLGANYEEYLKKTTSVLVCGPGSVNKEKLKFAAENGIPAVTIDWLLHSVDCGERSGYQDYVVQPVRSVYVEKESNPVEVPTRRLSEEDGSVIGERKSKAATTRATPDHRKVPQRSNKPKSPQREPKGKIFGRNLNDNEVSKGANKPPSQPLQEIPLAVNLPHSGSTPTGSTKCTVETAPAAKHATPTPEAAPVVEKPNLNNAIAALLAQKQASRSNSTVSDSMETNRQRRRKGLLGRANSSINSNSSMNEGDSFQGKTHPENIGDASESYNETEAESDWRREPAVVELPPGTQLVYENPEARKAREIMLAKMGGAMDEDIGGTSKEIGVVKDLAVDIGALASGAGGRAGRRRK